MINHLGKCPHCGTNWAAGDMAQKLASLDMFSYKQTHKESDNLARMYGWTPEEGGQFTNVTIIQIGNNVFYQCPNMRCCHTFNRDTHQEYASRVDLDFGKEFERKPLIVGTKGNMDDVDAKVFYEPTEELKQYPMTPDQSFELDEEPPFIPDEDKFIKDYEKGTESSDDNRRGRTFNTTEPERGESSGLLSGKTSSGIHPQASRYYTRKNRFRN